MASPAPATASTEAARAHTMEDQIVEIVSGLSQDLLQRVTLEAEAGVGVTWMAREISGRLRSTYNFFTIWVPPNKKYTEEFLYETIAMKLSLLPTEEDREDDDSDEMGKEGEETGILDSGNLKEKISRELAKLANKKCLWILDFAGNNFNGTELDSSTQNLEALCPSVSKFLITVTVSRERNQNPVSASDETTTNISDQITESANDQSSDETKRKIVVKPLSADDSWKLFRKTVGNHTLPSRIEDLFKKILRGDMCFPAAITMMAESLIYHLKHNPEDKKFESALEEIAERVRNDIAQLHHIAYGLLPNNTMIDCYWHCRQFFHNHNSAHYSELITYWILEGHLGSIDRIETAYNSGHLVLMQLLKRGLLKKLEGSFFTMEATLMKFADHRLHGYGGTASLGLACVFEDGEWEGLGRITQGEGMIKSFRNDEKWEKISTLVLDRHRLCRDGEIPNLLISRLRGLKVLALIDSQMSSLSFLSNLPNLQVLVLRGCHLIVNIDPVQELKSLTVLEISGASSLRKIPDNLFEKMTDLRSLNLSGASIEWLPSSIFKRSNLHWLILRDCSQLRELPGVKELQNLEIIDLSGAASLESTQEKRLFLESASKKFKMLDLSRSTILKLPFLRELVNLTRLLLSGCSSLQRLPYLNSLSGLQFLDISNCPKLNEIQNESFEDLKNLELLNLSNTPLDDLPSLSNLSLLRWLLLKDCSSLERLPNMDGLLELEHLDLSGCIKVNDVPRLDASVKLKVLDLSGCSGVTNLKDNFFGKMSHLVKLKLSETQIRYLPPLSKCLSLSHLLLRDCEKLEKLPSLNLLSKLEVLDLCGAKLLGEIETDDAGSLIGSKEVPANLFVDMAQLRNLDLSEVLRIKLSSISGLENLCQLSLRGCSNIERVPDLEKLVKLDMLNLSGTAVKELSSLASLTNLRSLFLKDCSELLSLPSLETLRHLEELDLSGTKIREFPYGVLKSTRLKLIGLPKLEEIQLNWEDIRCLPENLSWDSSVISSFAGYLVQNRNFLATVMGTKFFQFLKEVLNQVTPNWERKSNQFHISVFSRKQSDENVDHCYHCYTEEFREIYSMSRKFRCLGENLSSMEIRGFHDFIAEVEDVLKSVESVLLVDNSFKFSLSNLSPAKMRGCSIDSCDALESIFPVGDGQVGTGSKLEELRISNMTKLVSIVRGNMQSNSLCCLKYLYLDSCPLLVTVFPTRQVPGNLEYLQIRFCDRVETVFEEDCELAAKLSTLDLFDLPGLNRIGGNLSSLKVLKIRKCPQVKDDLTRIIKLVATSLQTLSIANAVNLRNVYYDDNSQSDSFKKLEYLSIDSCPMLVKIFCGPTMHDIPQLLVNLETIQLKFCENLETFWEDDAGAAAVDDAGSTVKLPKLHELRFWRLPKFRSIVKSVMPLQSCSIKECPLLPCF